MLRSTFAIVLILAFSLFIQCSEQSTGPGKTQRELTAVEKKLVDVDNSFGIKLFKQVVREENREGQKNVFISPLSVAMALGMTYNGANGSTQEAMQSALELQGMTLEEINQSYQSLIDFLMHLDPKVQFQIANSIWYEQRFSVEQPFIDLNRTYFDAVVSALDFRSPQSVVTINDWVNEKTNGKISKILERIPDGMLMYLINAIYFKGTWTTQFDPNKTKADLFHKEDNSTISCKMMSMIEEKFPLFYDWQEGIGGVDLPYGDGTYSMTVLMPLDTSSVDDLIEQLNDETWKEWTALLQESKFNLYLPKFKLVYEKRLDTVLASLGMGIAFSDTADFKKINRLGGILISEVKHKTFVQVDEEGTEAAAVTSVGMGPTSGPMMFRVDRPFIFALRERKSGTILFLGKIVEPTW